MAPKRSLLLIEDEPAVAEATRVAFEMEGYQVTTAASAEEAFACLRASRPHLLLIDYKLPGMSGTEFLRTVRGTDPNIPAILITGLANTGEDLEEESRRMGVVAFLYKPLKIGEILQAVEKALP
jgi:CheY-like chemotaxis protein